jgi:uncharacterized protein (DUF305 family)
MEQKTTLLFAMIIIGSLGGYIFGVNAGENHLHAPGETCSLADHADEIEGMMHGVDNMSMAEMMAVMNDDLGERTGEEFEIAFLEGMIDHHVGAVDMAELVLENTDRPELVQMANDIIEVQTAEIEMMQQWRDSWYD